MSKVEYDRDVLTAVITYHRKVDIKGCMCGWAVLGADHSEHVADVYEQFMSAEIECLVCGGDLRDGHAHSLGEYYETVERMSR